MRSTPLLRLVATLVCGFSAVSAFAQTPAFTIVNHGLDATLGNAGKGIFDPQVSGITGVAFGAGLFVVMGASGNDTNLRWATSPDGTTWTARSQPVGGDLKTFSTSRVHFLNGKFLFFTELTGTGGGGFAYSSTDGLTWTRSNVITTGRMIIVEFDASPTLTVAASTNGAQYASADLMTWTSRPVVAAASGFDHNDLAYGTGRFYSSINGFGGTTYASTDAVTWTSISSASVPGGGRVASGNGITLLTAGGNFYRSTDGVAFSRYTPTIPSGFLGLGGDPHFTGGRFVSQAVALTGTSYLGSSDGLTWTMIGNLPASPPITPVGGVSRLWVYSDIVFGNGKYVQVANESQQTVSTRVVLPLIMTIDAAAAPTPPSITTQPAAQNAIAGGTATFSVALASSAGVTYQWKKDDVNIAGATSATLTVNNVSAANAGSYTVVVTNAVGSITSSAATLQLVTASNVGRLINMSIRTTAGTGDNTLIVGVGLGGAGTSGNKAVLIRGVGPTLSAAFGLSTALADPVMTAFQGQTQVAQNDDWPGGFDFASLGAFAFSGAAPRDAAIYNAAIASGSYSIQIAGKNNATGIALAEIYDATPTASFSATTPRLVNVSARTSVGTGDNILIAGFVIGGSSPVRVLIRASGPALAALGVGGTLVDPRLEVFGAGNARVAENDNWAGTAELKAAFTSVAAFAFAADTSRDAALVATLQPGNYTAQVTGVGNTTGVALIEVYELP